jgi:hypothetical protein
MDDLPPPPAPPPPAKPTTAADVALYAPRQSARWLKFVWIKDSVIIRLITTGSTRRKPTGPPGPAPKALGFYPDPVGRYRLRYSDGEAWTDRVSNGRGELVDPEGTVVS